MGSNSEKSYKMKDSSLKLNNKKNRTKTNKKKKLADCTVILISKKHNEK